MATIGTASITLTDISDAIIAGSMPASTNPGQLWIDTSGATNVLKVYKNGQWITQELDVESMDSHLKQTIQTITDTLGTISDDNKLNHADRVMIVDSLADILGVVPSTKTTNKYPTALPDYTVLDANGSGTFASYRSSAIALGIEATSGEYIELKDAYLALINYLQLLASGNVMPWDITEANKDKILDVDSDQFRQTWLDYYMAEQALVRRILEVPGPAGAPAISGILDNDSVTIPTKADGTEGIYTRASTKMLVYVGDTNDTAKWSFSAAKDPSAGIVGTLTGNLYVVSSMSADTGYVDLTASREGYASVSKRFSLTKAKQGDTVVDYWVETDYPVIVKDRDDVYTPTALTITAHTQTGTDLPKSFSGIIKIEESNDGKVYTSKYTSTKPESSKVWTPSAGIKSMRIKLLTANGVNQLDYEIVQVVADGKDGADGYSPIYSELTNESMTITTDVNGANGGYGGAESTIHIYQGQVEITDQYNISVAISEGSGIIGTKTGSTYKVTKMTADSGYVDFIATRSGHLTLTRRFTISKSKTGAAGKPATSRWLTLDTPVIRKMVTGAYFPASITMKAWQATGDQAPTAYTGSFRISINTGGSTYTVKTTTGDVTSHTYSVPENVTGIKIELLSTGGATWLDEETIQVIQDGKDGAPGKDGLSAVVGFLTNENISVQATYNGAVSNYGHVKGTFEVYYGNTRVTGSNVSYSVDTANTSNLKAEIDSVTGEYKVTGITSGTSVTSGVATLKAVYEGVTITKVLTVTKSMAGTNGGNATAYWMITSAGIVSRTLDAVFTPSTITFTGKSKTGTAAPTNYSGRFVVEQTTNGSTWTSLSNTGKNVTSVIVTPTGAAIAVRAKFYLAGGTSVLLDEQTVPIVTDITDEVLTDIKDDIDDKTGTGLWKLDTYMGTTDLIPDLKHTRDNTKLVKSDTIKDFTNSAEYTADTNKVYHLYTHLETAAATNIALKVDHTAGIRILVNGGEPIYTSSVSGLAKTVTLPLTQGWNTVDILLRSTTAGAYVKFDKLISASVVKMSSYLGGGVSTSRLLMMQDEISFAVVQGERVAGLTITNDVINGANVEISGDTTFKDDLIMDAGLIQDAKGDIKIDLNKGEINLSKPLTINYVPVATKQQLDEIELTPGKSAYELAVDAGFVGTESQWRASLKGDPGEQGPDGISPIVGFLTNESITLPASDKGVVPSFAGATGTFEVYDGTTRKTGSGVAYSVSGTPSDITVSINATTGVYTVSAMTTGASVLSGTATLRAVYGGVTIDKILTVTKALAGTQGPIGGTGGTGPSGKDATTYWINASTNAIKKDVSGTIVPNTITFSGFSKTGTANPVAYAGRFIIQTSTDGASYTTAYTSSANQSSYTYTVPTTASFVKARYYLAGGTSTLLDEQTIPVLVDAEGIDKKYEGQSLLDKTEVLSGTEIFTDKADDSVVHVDIDGKSVGGGSGKNLWVGLEPSTARVWSATNTTLVADAGKTFASEPTLKATAANIATDKGFWKDLVRIPGGKTYTYSFMIYTEHETYFNSSKIGHVQVLADGSSDPHHEKNIRVSPSVIKANVWTKASVTFDLSNEYPDYRFRPYMWYLDANKNYWFSQFQLEEGSTASDFEIPAPTPDLPIAIHSLNNFDVVSSVGKENLLRNSDFKNGYTHWLESGERNQKLSIDTVNSYMGNNSMKIVASGAGNGLLGTATTQATGTFYEGETVSVSFYAKSIEGNSSLHTEMNGGAGATNFTLTKEWKKYKTLLAYRGSSAFYFWLNGSGTCLINSVKLEKGETETPWSGHLSEIKYDTPNPTTHKTNILLSEPLRSAGDAKDRLFRDSDGPWKVERNVGEHTINNVSSKNNENTDDYLYVARGVPNFSYMTENLMASHVPRVGPAPTGTKVGIQGNNIYDVLYLNIGSNNLAVNTIAEMRNWLSNNPITIQYELAKPYVETLPQVDQDKLNNIASYKDSNYVYTVINDKTDTISENLKPTLHATFKGGGWYARFKTEQGFNQANKSVDSLKSETIPALKDGLLNSSEKEAVRQSLNVVSADKKGIDMQFTTVHTNTALTGNPKTNLYNSKVALDTAFGNLQSAINAVLGVGDGTRITTTQMTLVTTRLNEYGTALSTYNQRYEQAQDAISSAKEKASKDYALAQANLAETQAKAHADGKVTAEEKRAIADAQAKLNEAKKYIDTLEVGGRNLIAGTNEESLTLGGYPASGYSEGISGKTILTPDKDSYVLSFEAKSTVNGDKIRCHFYMPNTTTRVVTSTGYTTTSVDGTAELTLTNQWKRYWVKYTQNGASTTEPKSWIIGRRFAGFGTGTVFVKGIKLEEGNMPTDWTPAPEDVEAQIGEKADQSNLDAVIGDVDAIKEDLDTKVDENTFIAQQTAYEEWLTRVELSATTAEQLSATLDLATVLIDTDLKGQAQRWSTLDGFVQIDSATGTFSIKSNNNGTQMVLTDDAMSFLSGGELVATITNQYLQIARGIFTSSAQIGRHKFEPLASDNDHFVLSYVGKN